MVEEMEDFSVELSIDDDGGLNLQLGASLNVAIIDNGMCCSCQYYCIFLINICEYRNINNILL